MSLVRRLNDMGNKGSYVPGVKYGPLRHSDETPHWKGE